MLHIHSDLTLETRSEQENLTYADHGLHSTYECLLLLGLPCNCATFGQSQIRQQSFYHWVLLSTIHCKCFQPVPKRDFFHCSLGGQFSMKFFLEFHSAEAQITAAEPPGVGLVSLLRN